MYNINTFFAYQHRAAGVVNSRIDMLRTIVDTHVGEYKWSARSNDFNGWLLCDGRSIERTTYPKLFEVIGTAFGEGGSSNEFCLPDFRGRVMGAVGQSGSLANRALGDAVGAETHTLSVAEIPAHTHTGTVDSAGAHVHTASTASNGSHNHGGATGTDGMHSHVTNATGGTIGLATANGNNTATAADSSPNELNVWSLPQALTVNSNGDHTHTIASDGAHAHTVTVDSSGAHTHTFTTGASGSNVAHNIMQPTLFAGNVFVFSGVLLSSIPV